jgi:hypothetical protein
VTISFGAIFQFIYGLKKFLWFQNYNSFPISKGLVIITLDHCPIQRCVSIPYYVVHSHTGACWHGDVDLQVVPRWHASTHMCTLLGCFKDIFKISVGVGDSHDADMELEGNGPLDIYDDAPIIAYL